MISIQIPVGENWVRDLGVARDVAAAMLDLFRRALDASSPFSKMVVFRDRRGNDHYFTREEARWAERTLFAAMKRDGLMCGGLMRDGVAL